MSTPPLPEDFLAQLSSLLGDEEAIRLKEVLLQAPKISIRCNPAKPFARSLGKRPIPWTKTGFYLDERPSFTLDPAFHAGAYYVQEASSMIIEYALHQLGIPKGIYLDLAAAPGGKSTLLSSYLGEEGFLVANEVIQARAQILKENIIKWGLGNVLVSQNDPEHFTPLEGFFDLVLVDAPCSGEGMFRKDPQAREEWSEEHVALCCLRQKRILDKAASLVKGGGYLIYSTCTFNRKENEGVISALLEEFAFTPVRIPLDPSWGIEESRFDTEEGQAYGYRFYPHRVEGEGFFFSILQRPESFGTKAAKSKKEQRVSQVKPVGEKEGQALEEELGLDGKGSYFLFQENLFRIQKSFSKEVASLLRTLNVRYFGVELGKKQGKEWIPSHEWAISTLPKFHFPSLELSKEESLDFLRKKDFPLEQAPSGWVLLTYRNLPLGWVKKLDKRVNNYYPKEWRIRMENPNG
ncbi:MAG: methyltransferase RsmF C-terminal domain-like protein [Bacteroidota bacterium]|jgi:16S rRNA C967 or C1407 C5-methylase (RsmB/RsmF family)/NOL1/NOP2/fmu family ribosome biogenesis protein|nr:tRNA/rRNA cytosine-C5-methylase [Algoriphagus sp.]